MDSSDNGKLSNVRMDTMIKSDTDVTCISKKTSTAQQLTPVTMTHQTSMNGTASLSYHSSEETDSPESISCQNIVGPFASIAPLPSYLVDSTSFLPSTSTVPIANASADHLSKCPLPISQSSNNKKPKKRHVKSFSDDASYIIHPSNTFTLLKRYCNIVEDAHNTKSISMANSKYSENLINEGCHEISDSAIVNVQTNDKKLITFQNESQINNTIDHRKPQVLKYASNLSEKGIKYIPQTLADSKSTNIPATSLATSTVRNIAVTCTTTSTTESATALPCHPVMIYMPAILLNHSCTNDSHHKSHQHQQQLHLQNSLTSMYSVIVQPNICSAYANSSTCQVATSILSKEGASVAVTTHDPTTTTAVTSVHACMSSGSSSSLPFYSPIVDCSCGTRDSDWDLPQTNTLSRPIIRSAIGNSQFQKPTIDSDIGNSALDIVTNQPKPTEPHFNQETQSQTVTENKGLITKFLNTISTQTEIAIDPDKNYVFENMLVNVKEKNTTGCKCEGDCSNMTPKAKSCDSILEVCNKELDKKVKNNLEGCVVKKKSFMGGICSHKQKTFNFDIDEKKKNEKSKMSSTNSFFDANKLNSKYSQDNKLQNNDFTSFVTEHLKQNKKIKNSAIATSTHINNNTQRYNVAGGGAFSIGDTDHGKDGGESKGNNDNIASNGCGSVYRSRDKAGPLLQHLQCHMPQSPTLHHRTTTPITSYPTTTSCTLAGYSTTYTSTIATTTHTTTTSTLASYHTTTTSNILPFNSTKYQSGITHNSHYCTTVVATTSTAVTYSLTTTSVNGTLSSSLSNHQGHRDNCSIQYKTLPTYCLLSDSSVCKDNEHSASRTIGNAPISIDTGANAGNCDKSLYKTCGKTEGQESGQPMIPSSASVTSHADSKQRIVYGGTVSNDNKISSSAYYQQCSSTTTTSNNKARAYCVSSVNGDLGSLSSISSPGLSPSRLDDWIYLNIGGQEFTTSRATLILEEPESMLARMFGGQHPCLPPASLDSHGRYVIDRSPQYFGPLLNYLRTGILVLDQGTNPLGVLQEARYYGLEGIITRLEQMVMEEKPSDTPLSRVDVVKALMSTTASAALRFQAINLRGADLSWLDLRNINFKVSSAACPTGDLLEIVADAVLLQKEGGYDIRSCYTSFETFPFFCSNIFIFYFFPLLFIHLILRLIVQWPSCVYEGEATLPSRNARIPSDSMLTCVAPT